MKTELARLLTAALQKLEGSLVPSPIDPDWVSLERTRDPAHGDFASNVALRLAKAARRNPRELAQAIVAALPANDLIMAAEVAGAGFINFRLAQDLYLKELVRVHEQGAAWGRSTLPQPRRVLVEFVSANPTGPLHVGHGRQATYGDALARILEAAGHDVGREYYVNDAGRQMEILAVSLWLRYLEACGETLSFPANGYRGDYLLPVAAALRTQAGDRLRHPAAAVFTADLPPDAPAGDKDQYIDAVIARARALLGEAAWQDLLRTGRDAMLADIRDDLDSLGITFDVWTSEKTFADSGAIDRALERLREQGRLYVKDGATWFRATEFGDDEDRVVIRENGVKTYFAADIAYHLDKRERGFDTLIDVLGADHHGYVARVRGGLQAFGHPADCLEACLIQLVALYRNGVKLSMGKREATFVTLRQLREEVGNDACRLFYLMRGNDQPLDFDLELAKSKSNENPVFYIQYAHARVASVLKEAAARGFSYDPARARDIVLARGNELLAGEHAQAMLAALSKYPEVVVASATHRAPHTLVHYLRDFANTLHTFYNAERVLVAEDELRHARLYLLTGVQQALRNGLALLGVSAPESM
ncbi:MAG: arginine--tRNA ligase [Steroidobacteraceae bacterium]|nr:arginine--tRNA ligase [Nevskiaceae bacterium]MCP5340389.1 arginine--tRNA ligase [Nevskiaceae bacterium]MCP5360229.1 arginine--tRNA ligase [Nevskiaceae bacterium]MCP5466634.1 arginine--tRNA ligase [Nevskiaceae bacterium]